MGSRVTQIIAAHPDIVDYVGRALIDGSPSGTTISDTLAAFGMARWNQRKERGEVRAQSPVCRYCPSRTSVLAASCGDRQTLTPPTFFRYVDGVSPQNCAKARVNALRLSKPMAVEVSCTD